MSGVCAVCRAERQRSDRNAGELLAHWSDPQRLPCKPLILALLTVPLWETPRKVVSFRPLLTPSNLLRPRIESTTASALGFRFSCFISVCRDTTLLPAIAGVNTTTIRLRIRAESGGKGNSGRSRNSTIGGRLVEAFHAEAIGPIARFVNMLACV